MKQVAQAIGYFILGIIAFRIIWALIKVVFGLLGIAFTVVAALISFALSVGVTLLVGYGIYRLVLYATKKVK